MDRSLLDHAEAGWTGELWQGDFGLVGSPDWMAWRAGLALKESGFARPEGVTMVRPLNSLLGEAPPGVYVFILPKNEPGRAALFKWALPNGSSSREWIFWRLDPAVPRLRDLLEIWLRRRGWITTTRVDLAKLTHYHEQPDRFEIWFRFAGGAVGVFAILFGLSVTAYQALLWLKTGMWSPLTVSIGLEWLFGGTPKPAFSWLGVQQAALWTLECPLSLGAMVAGLFAIVCAATNLFQYLCALAVVFALFSIFNS